MENNLIKREDVYASLANGLAGSGYMEIALDCISDKRVPAVDAVPVVRCGQCRFTDRDGSEDPAIYCQKWDMWEMPEDGYCWLGKRREDGDT